EAWIRDALVGLNTGNPNQLEVAVMRAREVLAKITDPAVRETYRERAAGWIGVQPHLLSADAPTPSKRPPSEGTGSKNGLRARESRTKVSPSRYLLQLLAVRPVAYEVVRTKITPAEFDETDRDVFLRMLGSYERGGDAGLASELAG